MQTTANSNQKLSRKILIIGIIFCVVVFCFTFFKILSQTIPMAYALANKQSSFEKKKSALEAELQKVRDEIAARTPLPMAEREPALTPEKLIARLSDLVNPENRKSFGHVNLHLLQEVSYCCRGLILAGEESIPAMHGYLDSGHNVQVAETETHSRITEYNDTYAKLGAKDSFLPVTSRMGIAYALRDIGGAKAIALLNGMFQAPANRVELLQVGAILVRLDNTHFRAPVATAFRNLLASAEKEDRFKILSFVRSLGGDVYADLLGEENIYTKEGKIDLSMLSYVLDAQKGKAMPFMAETFTKLQGEERKDFVKTIMNYLDDSPASKSIINTLLVEASANKETFPSAASALILSLSGLVDSDPPWDQQYGSGSSQSSLPRSLFTLALATDPFTAENLYLSRELAQDRLVLLSELEAQYGSDEVVAKSFATARSLLQYNANPEAYPDWKIPDTSFLEELDSSFFPKENIQQGIIIIN